MKNTPRTLIFLSLCILVLGTSQTHAAKGIKCRVFQESVSGLKRLASKDQEFTVSKNNKNESTYLSTVVSELDAELVDSGIKLAVSNGLGKHRKTLKFKKGAKRLSKTFIYPSDNPNVIRNKVKVECLK